VCLLAGRDVASFPRKLLGDPLLIREGVLISPNGAVYCVSLSLEGRRIIFKEAVLLTSPHQ
jgi:hypothetical protein